jgi:hypothetical protein
MYPDMLDGLIIIEASMGTFNYKAIDYMVNVIEDVIK